MRAIHELKMDFSVFAYRVSMWAILFRRLLKLASVLGRLEIGFDECKSSFDSVLARIVPAFVLGRLEADYDDGISSSESELFYCGDLIGEIGGVWLSLILASMAMTFLSSIAAMDWLKKLL